MGIGISVTSKNYCTKKQPGSELGGKKKGGLNPSNLHFQVNIFSVRNSANMLTTTIQAR